jgi:hypothetical protein
MRKLGRKVHEKDTDRWKRQAKNEIWVRGWEVKQQRDREVFCSV